MNCVKIDKNRITKGIEKPRIAVGLPTYNEAEYVGHVTAQIDKGLLRYPDEDPVIVNLDSRSKDGTCKKFMETRTIAHKRCMEVPRGKGSGLVRFFEFCLENEIPRAVTVDADLLNIKDFWIQRLADPLSRGHDFVIPIYARHKYDANITNHFSYPLILAVFGVELRQPLAGEFGYSRDFYKYLLSLPRYYHKARQYGIDTLITHAAVTGGFRIKEVYLDKKIHSSAHPHREALFRQVFETAIATSKPFFEKEFPSPEISRSGTHSGTYDNHDFFYRPILPRLIRNAQMRFEKYYLGGAYNTFFGNDPVVRKIKAAFDGGDMMAVDAELWTNYLAAALKKCYRDEFDTRNLMFLSRITWPVFSWRFMSHWLTVEHLSVKKTETLIKEQAALLRDKMS
jgi:glycosyltransferase involved in cell wall biosynthesis